MTIAASTSEEHGLDLLTDKDLLVYSVGISTGGIAEIRMTEMNPARRIIATTIDDPGLNFAREQIVDRHLEGRIEIRLEDVAEPLPYDANHFDYIYARLVLHYLARDKLVEALSELYRALKPGGKIFIVVRSDKCDHAHMPDSVYGPVTELTEYTETDPVRGIIRLKRHFFSEDDLAAYFEKAGFTMSSVTAYDEHLFKDFKREALDTRVDNVVELVEQKLSANRHG